MSNEVIAKIDISTPSGRKIVRELEKKRAVKLEYPLPEGMSVSNITVDEYFDELERQLEAHYANEKI